MRRKLPLFGAMLLASSLIADEVPTLPVEPLVVFTFEEGTVTYGKWGAEIAEADALTIARRTHPTWPAIHELSLWLGVQDTGADVIIQGDEFARMHS